LCWMLFPENAISKYLAAVIPFWLVLLISIVATVVEFMSPSDCDNFTVPGVAIMTPLLLF
jgi:dolichol kinase